MATFRAIILKGDIHVKSDNTSNIKIRITHNKKADYISTDLFVNPDNFKKGYAIGDNSDFINMRITDYIGKYQRRYLELGDMAAKMTAKELREEVTKDKSKDIDFIKFAEAYLEELVAEGKKGSHRSVVGFLANLKEYRPNVSFGEITPKFLKGFENFMKRKGIGNGIQTYMARFRVVFNRGREFYNDEDRGIIRIPNYPFRKYKITQPVVHANENSLSVHQLHQLMRYVPVTPREIIAQDMFQLMFFLIGINSKDLYQLSKPDKAGRVNFLRSKTGRKFSIKLEPEAIKIIERYIGEKKLINASENYTDHLNFQKAINIGLKSICEKIRSEEAKKNKHPEFPEKITSNWARHTWATIARNDCRISKDDVALCLGHEDQDNRVTDMYIKYDYSIIDEANKKVIQFLSEKLKDHKEN